MGTTLSMILGLVFVLLGVTAVLLQAWLWGFPMDGDRSTAPRRWVLVHRLVGLSYASIYALMMYHMLPRLWIYQVELPARSVIHAVAAINIGILLLTKLAIIRLFPHFGGALPKLGLGLLINTVLLGALSLPYALRAHTLTSTELGPEKLARVHAVLSEIPFPEGTDVDALAAKRGLERGREILTHKCTICHDMRTILAKPRTGRAWYGVVQRMAEKPIVMGEPIGEDELAPVTAYLVAITPDLQQSAKIKVKEQAARRERAAEIADLSVAEAPAAFDAAKAKEVFASRCSQCHDTVEVEAHGGDDEAGWTAIVRRMVEDEGAEVEEADAAMIVRYLAETYPKK
ncbi:MAG: hypothetical protein R3A51_03325 [Nannocystaceae bacterium]